MYHVSKSLGHSSTEVTERHYADLAPGAAKELPNMLERFVLETSAEKNGMECGLRYDRGFAGNWRFSLRGDIGGFGVGSDYMYHLLAAVGWQPSESLTVFGGYRLISFDYEDGSGRNYQRYDLTEQGPMLGVGISF